MDVVKFVKSYIVRCNYCCIGTIHMKNKQNAIKLWNHRTEVTDND